MITDLPEMPCRELVELITDYLEDRLSPTDRARFEAHLAECVACRTYLEQFRQTTRVLGHLPEESLSPRARNALLDAFLASAPVARGADDTEEEMDALQAALGRLGEGQRRCLVLFYLEGHSYAEVARQSGYALNEVKSHIQNGKRSLRMLLRPSP